MEQPLIEAKNLKKYFQTPAGALHAVDDVSFIIERGKTLGVVGESGCGKSTLGRAILRLHEPTGGQVLFKGRDMATLSKSQLRVERRKLQIIFQDPYSSLNPRMNVQDLISEPMTINKLYPTRAEVYRRTAQLMDTVGLAARFAASYPHELDGGRRQRIGIARALSLDPEFIVCDEPVSTLDVSIQAQILNLLMDLQRDNNLTYMFITHDLSVVRHISDDIIVMYLGQCVERAPAKQLFIKPMHPYTKALLSAIPVPVYGVKKDVGDIIQSEVTSPISPKPGCRFAPRCPIAQEACAASGPRLREIAPGHSVACFLVE